MDRSVRGRPSSRCSRATEELGKVDDLDGRDDIKQQVAELWVTVAPSTSNRPLSATTGERGPLAAADRRDRPSAADRRLPRSRPRSPRRLIVAAAPAVVADDAGAGSPPASAGILAGDAECRPRRRRPSSAVDPVTDPRAGRLVESAGRAPRPWSPPPPTAARRPGAVDRRTPRGDQCRSTPPRDLPTPPVRGPRLGSTRRHTEQSAAVPDAVGRRPLGVRRRATTGDADTDASAHVDAGPSGDRRGDQRSGRGVEPARTEPVLGRGRAPSGARLRWTDALPGISHPARRGGRQRKVGHVARIGASRLDEDKFATVGLDLRRRAAAAGRLRPGAQRGRHQHPAVPQRPAAGPAGVQRDGHRHRVPDGHRDGPARAASACCTATCRSRTRPPRSRSSSGPRPAWSPTRSPAGRTPPCARRTRCARSSASPACRSPTPTAGWSASSPTGTCGSRWT